MRATLRSARGQKLPTLPLVTFWAAPRPVGPVALLVNPYPPKRKYPMLDNPEHDRLSTAVRTEGLQLLTHRRNCHRCNTALIARQLDKLCDDGYAIAARRQRAQAALDKWLDAQAAAEPGQQTLFDLEG